MSLPDPFERAVALWAIGLAGSDRVAVAAAELLAEGTDSPALSDLAGRSRGENWFEMRDVIARAFTEIGRPDFDPKSARLRHAAVADYAIDLLNEQREASEVAALADRLYRSDDPADQALADLRQLDNDPGAGGASMFTRRTRAAARRFLTELSESAQPGDSEHLWPPRAGVADRNPRHRSPERARLPSFLELKTIADAVLVRGALWLLLAAVVISLPFSAVLCVSEIVTAHDKTYRGTFTLDHSEPGRGADTEYGRFVSDDQSIRLSSVRLEGSSGTTGRVEVTYEPSGVLGDALTGTVYTSTSRDLAAVLPWMMLMGSTILNFSALTMWRDLRAERARDRSTMEPEFT